MEAHLNGFDILALVLGANLLTLWGLSGFWRLSKKDEWDWYSIFAIGVPFVVLGLATYFGNWFSSF